MKYVPALDGLRALAVILVVLFHTGTRGFGGAAIGVDIFFVLSGYLITSLLMVEIDDTRRIDYVKFYLRRVLRLYPALLVMLAGALLCFHPSGEMTYGEAAVAGLYLTDYAITFGFISSHALVMHTWSLAVEEHFYILWPALLAFLYRRKRRHNLVKTLAFAYVAATLWKIGFVYSGESWQQVDYRFDTRLTGLILGALLAACRHEKIEIRGVDYMLPVTAVAMVEAIIVVPFAHYSMSSILTTIPAELFTFYALAKILDAPKSRFAAWLALPVPVYIGRISYAVYLFHAPMPLYLQGRVGDAALFPVVLAASIALASASYFTVELLARKAVRKYHLRRKESHL